MKNSGVTLTELIVVIAIVAILVVALGFGFQGWMGKYRVEAETKMIYSDLMDARARAMQFNREYYADFLTTTTYRVSADDSNGVAKVTDGDGIFQPQANPAVVTANTDTTLPTFPKTIEYPVNSWTGGTIQFDKRGIVQPSLTPLGNTIRLTLPADVDPDYDCIIIASTRINIGKWNTATTNCDAK